MFRNVPECSMFQVLSTAFVKAAVFVVSFQFHLLLKLSIRNVIKVHLFL